MEHYCPAVLFISSIVDENLRLFLDYADEIPTFYNVCESYCKAVFYCGTTFFAIKSGSYFVSGKTIPIACL